MDLALPKFSSEKLSMWFAQVESVYELYGIVSDSEKYNYVVANIPLEHISLVEDIILNPPPESKYDHLKYEFIKRTSIYWLKKQQMGNEKPSEYLQRLRKMANHRVPQEAVLNTWLNHLPKPARDVISLETSGRVEVIGAMADKVMALLPSPSARKLVLEKIDKLCRQVEELYSMLDTDGFEDD